MAFQIPRAEIMIPSVTVAVVAGLTNAAISTTVKIARWWFRKPLEESCTEALNALDDCDTGCEAGAELIATAGKMAKPVRRRVRRVAANSYALQAYLKFGRRPKSEANVIITRKYISDLLSEKQDIRIRDKVEIMDLATFLSFIPTKSSQLCGAYESTNAYAQRMLGDWQEL